MKVIDMIGIAVIASFLCAAVVLTALDHMDATKSHDECTYGQFRAAEPPLPAGDITVYLGVATRMTTLPGTNATIHIDSNQAQNVTIWKGDQLIAYIPR